MSGTESPFVSVVVPAYDEESNPLATARVLIERLSACVPSFEILIVDDASRDGTRRVAEQLAAADPRVRVFHHEENRGIGGGFVTGLRHARGEWFLLIPADLALDPEELPKYFQAARDTDVVVGIRSHKRDYSLFRRLVSWVNIRLIQLLFGMPERQFQYISLSRRSVLEEVGVDYAGSAFFLAEVLIKAKARGYRLRSLDIRYSPRVAGRSTGARPSLIARTVWDMLVFWWRGDWRRRDGSAGRAEP